MRSAHSARSTLFVSYDGLTDPLGGSQILPYLRSIAAHPRPLHVLSFEKPDRLATAGETLRAELDAAGIRWTPLVFSRGGLPAKVRDLASMYAVAIRLAWQRRFGVVHCRGHLAAQVGALLKALFGVRLIFDFRGLWVDERVDKGGWDLSRWRDRLAHRLFKRIERGLLRYSDHVVVLTQAILPYLASLGVQPGRMTVVPCCADFGHFRLPEPAMRDQTRRQLGLPQSGLVVGYLGSAGPMYMSGQFLRFAEAAIVAGGAAAVLCITPDATRFREEIAARRWDALGITYAVVSGTREDIPRLLSGLDVLVSFFLPGPARIGTSPTKMAECFAQGIPMVTNPGVGDVERLMDELDGGLLVDPTDSGAMTKASAGVGALTTKGGQRLREAARPLLGLEHASAQYASVYEKLETGAC
ncbi:MAG: glycosyltransferase [Burkholderiales bacterium]|nr:glycosyltransferase [Burkholderiales bacterium]